MIKNPVFYKMLVVGVIVLFIGSILAPSIYADNLRDKKFDVAYKFLEKHFN